MPPVLPDYIGQTVGGTLSVGGIGAMSFREGAQIDHVVALRAVTGEGQHRATARSTATASCSRCCSPARARSVSSSRPRCGCVPAPSTVRLYDLIYPDLATLLADITMLMEDERFDQMESFVIPTGPGQWLYLLEAIGVPHRRRSSRRRRPADRARRTSPSQTIITDLDFLDWSSRVPTNLPTRPNPWCDLLVPMSDAATFLEEVQATIAPIVARRRSSTCC